MTGNTPTKTEKFKAITFSLLLVASAMAAGVGTLTLASGTASAATGDEILSTNPHSDRITIVEFGPDDEYVYTGSADNTIKKINISSGDVEWTYSGFSGTVSHISLGVNGESIYASSYAAELSRIDADSGSQNWLKTGIFDTNAYTAEVGEDGEYVYSSSSDEAIKQFDVSDGTETQMYDLSGTAAGSVGDAVTSTGNSDLLWAVTSHHDNAAETYVGRTDISTGETEWKYTGEKRFFQGVDVSNDGTSLYLASGDADVVEQLSASDGEKGWETNIAIPGGSGSSDDRSSNPLVVGPGHGYLYVGGEDGNIHRLEGEAGIESTTYNASDGGVYGVGVSNDGTMVAGGTGNGDLNIFDTGIEESVSGQVVDQNGNPVPNATVTAVGVNYDELNGTAEEKLNQADELLDESENPLPDAWNPDLSLTGDSGHFQNVSSPYVAVHSASDWKIGSGDDDVVVNPNVDLSSPMISVQPDQELALSIWNPGNNCGVITGRCDAADSSLPGKTTSGTVVIEQIAPSGEVTDRRKVDTTDAVELNPSFSLSTKTHETANVHLPRGNFYRVYPEGNEASAYYVVSGDADDIRSQIVTDLKTEANQLTEQAETIQNRISDGTFTRAKATTDENGEFSLYMLSSVETVSLQAYKANGEILTDTSFPTMSDMRNVYERGYDGSVHTTLQPKRAQIPEDNVTLTAYKASSPPFANMSGYNDMMDKVLSEFENLARDELERLFQGELGNRSLAELENLRSEMETLAEENDNLRSALEDYSEGLLTDDQLETLVRNAISQVVDIDTLNSADVTELQNRVIEAHDGDGISESQAATIVNETIGPDITDSEAEEISTTIYETTNSREMVEQINDMESEMTSLENTIEELESGSEMTDDYASAFTLFGSELEKSGVQVVGHWSNGTSFTVPDEYVTLEQTGGVIPGQSGSTRVSVEDYPVNESDPASLRFEFRVVGSQGVGESIQNVVNPDFRGTVPSLDAISLSTLRPGPSEHVTVSAKTSDSAFNGVTNVEAIGPNQNNLETTKDNGEWTFQANGEGVHTVRVTYEDTTGAKFTEVFRMDAGDSPFDYAPTIRTQQGYGGPYTLVGGGLSNGEVEYDGGTTQLTAYSTESEINELHVIARSLDRDMRNSIDVQILSAGDEENIRRHVSLTVHTDIPESSLVYKNGNPVTSNAATPYGEVSHKEDKDLIYTYSDADGTASVTSNTDPGFVERIIFDIRVASPFSIPGLSSVSGAAFLFVAGVGARRRRGGGDA